MKPVVIASVGALAAVVGVCALGASALRYETTNMDRGVTMVLDHWTGNMSYCRIGRGCEPMTKEARVPIPPNCTELRGTIDVRDPNAADELRERIRVCPSESVEIGRVEP